MIKPNDRVIRATVAGVSLIALVVIGYPKVDEGFRLRDENRELRELEQEFTDTQQRSERLQRIENALEKQKRELIGQNVTPTKIGSVRDEVIRIVRDHAGSLRSLEIQDGQRRAWAEQDDDPRNRDIYELGAESEFELHSHALTLSVTGKFDNVLSMVESLTDHHWLMSLETMDLKPYGGTGDDVILEVNLTLYGLELAPEPIEETFT
ncbi:hypothetical protein [Neorhodopirellula pilleata]|uniref:Pilus assembly protein, PilO n=1 Tax=Neorhodopirellula pilleata TaxID=2714738 RepID=A0A5C6A217_9BACT|nr:hypothetical protein [Neorhodopirellula pilleata]TWT93589.1 hypothetical protein Pla100_41070 [Neorhodopirellula pilleata]